MKVFASAFVAITALASIAFAQDFAPTFEENASLVASPLRMTASVAVGCKNRVENVTLPNFILSEDRGSFLVFRSSVRVPHKCGETRHIGADASIVISRKNARMDASGVLYTPAVNAQIYCEGRTWWLNSSCMSYSIQ